MENNSFSSLIDSASSVLILLPSKPYFDQVAAGLSLYLAIKGKKETTIACSEPMVVEFNRLVGVNKISTELGNKNLILKFVNYPASDIEKVSADIEEGEFRLTVVPKTGLVSPKKEQVDFSYSGVAADTVILVGGGNEGHFPQLSSPDLANTKIAHVGTRSLATNSDKQIMSFAKPASSTSELVASLIEQSGLSLDPDIATNLLAGVEEGSKEFKGQDVTAETFEGVAKLLRAGGRRPDGVKVDRGDFPPGAIPGEKVVTPETVVAKKDAPKDWLEPKIYKGTSIS